ncbi:SagB/ThcOx family dehydrogenase [Thiovibrio sp. JS02]
MPELRDSLGHRYFQETKLARDGMRSQLRSSIQETETFKTYPEAEKILLPRTWPGEGPSLVEILQQRRSLRKFADTPLSLSDLALLLWASQGITGRSGFYFFRTAPSAGALYPLETYLAIERVEGLAPGLYHLDVQGFQLERLRAASPGQALAAACLAQGFLARAAVNCIWTAVFRRSMAKYGHRGGRYIGMDAGHVCQNLILAAEFLGHGVCPVAAFFDDEVNALIGVDGIEESTLYLASIGARREP